MPRLDERLTRDLERAAEPRAAGPEIFSDIERRRDRHERASRVRRGALAVLVIAATVGGFLAVRTTVGDRSSPGVGPPENGRILFTKQVVARRSAGGFQLSFEGLWTMNADGSDPRPLPGLSTAGPARGRPMVHGSRSSRPGSRSPRLR
jgi:hypothetical protein